MNFREANVHRSTDERKRLRLNVFKERENRREHIVVVTEMEYPNKISDRVHLPTHLGQHSPGSICMLLDGHWSTGHAFFEHVSTGPAADLSQ